jgi:TatD DNase family protein
MMLLVDSHCHIYLHDFDEDRHHQIRRAEEAGVGKILMPAIDSTEHEALMKAAIEYPGVCLPMMGLHPVSVKENYEAELAIVLRYLEESRFYAIGEIGLDFYWDKSFTSQQYEAFERQIRWSLEHKLPVVIHSSNAIDECIEVVTRNQNGSLGGIFHCFTGTLDQAKKIIDLGFYLGIGGVVTFKNAGLDKVLEQLALENVVLETDAPYLAPVPYRGKRNECSYIKYVLQKVAEIKAMSEEEVAIITTANSEKIFGLTEK